MTLDLLLLRHAKSSWSEDEVPDHERPLNPRGQRAAKAIAKHMAESDLRPDTVLCSTAVRTRQTVDALLKRWPDLPVTHDDALYLAVPEAIISVVSACDPAKRVLVVGHIPGMEQLVKALIDPTARHNDRARADVSTKYPTAGLARLAIDIDSWKHLKPNSGRLIEFTKPRDLV